MVESKTLKEIKCKDCGALLGKIDNSLKAILTCESCGACLSYNVEDNKMPELKTLKDLKCTKDYYWEYIGADEELNQMVIDWIKYARRCKHPLDMQETFKTVFNVSEEDLK